MNTQPVTIHLGDVLDGLAKIPDGSVQCCVTSPPYWGLRDYGVEGQIGLEPTPDAFVAAMVRVFGEVRRTLREDGTLWLNLGDSYAAARGGTAMPAETLAGGEGGIGDDDAHRGRTGGYQAHRDPKAHGMKHKDLCMMPWRVALALQADGWYLRSVIVWAKKSPMPESVTDRPTSSWEPIFLMAKNERYFYDADAVRERGSSPEMGADEYAETCEAAEEHWYTRVTGPVENGKSGNRTGGFCPPGGRNQRNVWTLGPEPYADAHFATFPTEIPRRAIKAGTSEKGCCPGCGAPWKRVTTREKLTRERPNDYTKRSGENGTGNHCANTVAGVSTRTTGWAPGCGCAAGEPVPCLVLDPFLGSGTTIAVARELGRHGVGCELNPAYAELARIRIGKAEKPTTFVDPRAKDSPLFAGGAS
jgi:DNA modification methylase